MQHDQVKAVAAHLERRQQQSGGESDAVHSTGSGGFTSTAVLLGDFNLCARRAGPIYKALSASLASMKITTPTPSNSGNGSGGNIGIGMAENLCADFQWTCDLRLAVDPRATTSYVADHNAALCSNSDDGGSGTTAYAGGAWGATLDHAWVSSVTKKSGATCRLVNIFDATTCLPASDHLGLDVTIPLPV